MKDELQCPFCESKDIVKIPNLQGGSFGSDSQGTLQRVDGYEMRRCNNCKAEYKMEYVWVRK